MAQLLRGLRLQRTARRERYGSNNQRVLARESILAVVRPRFAAMSKAELIARLELAGLPFAPISRPEDLFDDPHLLASGALVATTLPDGEQTRLPLCRSRCRAGRGGRHPAGRRGAYARAAAAPGRIRIRSRLPGRSKCHMSNLLRAKLDAGEFFLAPGLHDMMAAGWRANKDSTWSTARATG